MQILALINKNLPEKESQLRWNSNSTHNLEDYIPIWNTNLPNPVEISLIAL